MLYTYAYYLDKHGLSLEELYKLNPIELDFCTAAMSVMREENNNFNVKLAELTGKIANPFIGGE